MQHRLERLRQALHERQLDALIVTNPLNRRYLSGFTGSAGVLLILADHALLLSDFRYESQAKVEATNFEFRLIVSDSALTKMLPELIQEFGIQKLGFEASTVSVAQFSGWRKALAEAGSQVQLFETEGLVEQLRQLKDASEIELLRRAVAIGDEAFAAIQSLLRPTMREREVAWELEKAMRERGAEGLAFEIIVAAGQNGARPHARAGDQELGTGRPVVMDFGARVEGYHGDMTRTVILGEADEQFWTIYNTVLEAQRLAEAGLRPGMNGFDADAIARDHIKAAGYGEQFGHSLGHGVGLAIHEEPRLSHLRQDLLSPGAVVSVEPGIYVPDWGGVRIEDLVVITDTGIEVLTQASKEPVVAI
ncbi:MAG: aminopeptidase P family protein [Chloroflexi bacterium]|nr:aminopeptidase P family protein [Chloroflexota bacterium]